MAVFNILLQDGYASLATTLSSTLFFVILAYFIGNEFVRYKARLKGIPGPVGLPIIGNLHQVLLFQNFSANRLRKYQLHNVLAAEQYRLWIEKYGDVFQVQLGNMPIVVINSAAAAKDIFLSQGSAMNSRPVFHVFHKVVSKG